MPFFIYLSNLFSNKVMWNNFHIFALNVNIWNTLNAVKGTKINSCCLTAEVFLPLHSHPAFYLQTPWHAINRFWSEGSHIKQCSLLNLLRFVWILICSPGEKAKATSVSTVDKSVHFYANFDLLVFKPGLVSIRFL